MKDEQTVMLVVKVMCVNCECSHCCKLCRFVGVLMTKIAVFSSEETRGFRRNVDAAILNVKSSDKREVCVVSTSAASFPPPKKNRKLIGEKHFFIKEQQMLTSSSQIFD